MAKSKAGGTRAYIRGKIGADVYSIGKDGKGRKQQVVRSLAEQVHNPQTVAQMRGRMIMSTVMQAVSAMSPIVDHSFDGIAAGQPSLSEFIRRNYALIKADVEAHPSAGNQFGLNKYQEKGVKVGSYIISKGNVAVPSWLSNWKYQTETILDEQATIGDVLNLLGISLNDYITVCWFSDDEGSMQFYWARFKPVPSIDLSAAATMATVSTAFTIETNSLETVGITGGTDAEGNKLTVSVSSFDSINHGVIISKKTASGYEHSTDLFAAGADAVTWNADTALPTYPVGSERFLNGGDI